MLRPGMKFINRMGPDLWDVWTIDNYWDFGMSQHTQAGALTKQAKYSHDLYTARKAADALGEQLAVVAVEQRKLERSQIYQAEAVVAVPFFGDKRLSLPHVLAARVAMELGIADRSHLVSKIRATDPTKLVHKPVVDATPFAVNWSSRARRVLIVDDVYRSGATLESLAVALRAAGVTPIAALCATRAVTGMALN